MTRRQVLAACCFPALSLIDWPASAAAPGIAIASEPHLLSLESAAAFRSLAAQQAPQRRATVVLAGAKHLSFRTAWELRNVVERGATVFCECGLAFSDQAAVEAQRSVLAQAFGMRLGQPLAASNEYAQYITFAETLSLIRPFGLSFPVSGDRCEPIAYFGDSAVGAKKTIGGGQFVYLGTMLGPHLLASDPDARLVATRLLTQAY